MIVCLTGAAQQLRIIPQRLNQDIRCDFIQLRRVGDVIGFFDTGLQRLFTPLSVVIRKSRMKIQTI
jgi:hypothetical protein